MSLKQRGHAMRTVDFAPFYRSTVGFDRLFSMLDQVGGVENAAVSGYPPSISNVRGKPLQHLGSSRRLRRCSSFDRGKREHVNDPRQQAEQRWEESNLIYQGIAERNFERNFQLADHVQIQGASLENGLLQVDLLRVVPEAMKPRAIL